MEDNKKEENVEVTPSQATPSIGATTSPTTSTPFVPESKPEMVELPKEKLEEIMKKLTMLESVADKGRVFDYKNKEQAGQKKAMTVHLSKYHGGIIVGWRTLKDELMRHPTTGVLAGETQEYELLIDIGGVISKVNVNSYSAFTEARYTERIEVPVVGRKEDMSGNWSFDVELPDGRVISLDSRFVN